VSYFMYQIMFEVWALRIHFDLFQPQYQHTTRTTSRQYHKYRCLCLIRQLQKTNVPSHQSGSSCCKFKCLYLKPTRNLSITTRDSFTGHAAVESKPPGEELEGWSTKFRGSQRVAHPIALYPIHAVWSVIKTYRVPGG